MNIEINYSKQVSTFLRKNSEIINEEQIDSLIISALKKIFKLEDINIDLKQLKGNLNGYF